MNEEVNLVSGNHFATKRDYLARVNNLEYPKWKAAEIAKKFDFDYWDGDRRINYGGYHFREGYWTPVAEKLIKYTDMPIRTLDTTADAVGYLRDLYNTINKLQGMMPYSEIVNNLDLVKDSINSTTYKLLFLK